MFDAGGAGQHPDSMSSFTPSEPQPTPSSPPSPDDSDRQEPGAEARQAVEQGEEEAVERYVDSPGAGLAGVLDDLPEPNEPG